MSLLSSVLRISCFCLEYFERVLNSCRCHLEIWDISLDIFPSFPDSLQTKLSLKLLLSHTCQHCRSAAQVSQVLQLCFHTWSSWDTKCLLRTKRHRCPAACFHNEWVQTNRTKHTETNQCVGLLAPGGLRCLTNRCELACFCPPRRESEVLPPPAGRVDTGETYRRKTTGSQSAVHFLVSRGPKLPLPPPPRFVWFFFPFLLNCGWSCEQHATLHVRSPQPISRC